MNCHCGEKAFTFTKIYSHDGKKYTSLVGRCNRSLEETNKKKKKCDFREEKVIKVVDLPCEEVKSKAVVVAPRLVQTREDNIRDLLYAINTIKLCQDTQHPFDKYTNRILYLSKKLNIPPYIQEKYTIEDYYHIAHHYLKNPIPIRKPVPDEKYSLIDDFLESIKNEKRCNNYKWKNGKKPKNFHESTSQELYEHFKKLLTIEKKVAKIKPTNRAKQKIVTNVVGEFKTGGIDDEDLVQEDELDIEEFESEEEQDDYDDGDYKSD